MCVKLLKIINTVEFKTNSFIKKCWFNCRFTCISVRNNSESASVLFIKFPTICSLESCKTSLPGYYRQNIDDFDNAYTQETTLFLHSKDPSLPSYSSFTFFPHANCCWIMAATNLFFISIIFPFESCFHSPDLFTLCI